LLGVQQVIIAGARKLLPLVALLLSVDRRLIDLLTRACVVFESN
jgi:hypothetical protein